MPNPGEELSSLDFAAMLGGPLTAVVNAQAQAALSTVAFIKQVGFKPKEDQVFTDQSSGDPIYVTFQYDKEVTEVVPANGNTPATTTTAVKPFELKVPMLTIVPVPYLRVAETTIAFNAKINAVEFQKTDSTLKIDSSLSAGGGVSLGSFLQGSARLKVSSSFQRTDQSGNSLNRTYSMAVNIKAVQDEMPAGMEKVLSILENSITSKPLTP